jgi:putative FmdB family regulatory protein
MTYEYACGACGHEWEAEQRISDAPIKKCPKCSKLQAKRQISRGAGFILKGGGWYADGYGSAKSGSGASGAESKPASGGSSSSESKPEAKPSDAGSSKPSETKTETKTETKGKTVAA